MYIMSAQMAGALSDPTACLLLTLCAICVVHGEHAYHSYGYSSRGAPLAESCPPVICGDAIKLFHARRMFGP